MTNRSPKPVTPGIVALLLLAFASLWPAAVSAESSKRLELDMVMYMAGFQAGTLALSVDFNDVDATSSLKMKSQGMVKMITGYKGKSEARTALPEEAWPVPVSYDSAYETRKYDRRIEIRYGAPEGDIADVRIWKRGEPRSSKVPESLMTATIDPLTAILHFRHWVLAMQKDPAVATEEAFEVFDGRRRYRLNADLIDRVNVDYGGRTLPVVRVKVVMEPLAGFSSRDMLANWSSEGENRWIELLITDDDNPVPLSVETKGGSLKTSVYLTKLCDGEKGCMKFES